MADVAEAESSASRQQMMPRRAVLAASLANFIEWLDYASYSYLAVVIAAVFFPSDSSTASVVTAFSVFGLSFLARPFGALFWGSMGDKKGRVRALSLSVLVMSLATFLIGCLPGYDTIGLAAPVLLLLLRCVQSFSASGEYVGAGVLIAEFAPAKRRGLYVSALPASTAVGLLAGSLFATALFSAFGAGSSFVLTWGWRIPFWLALPLGLTVFLMRSRLSDAPLYHDMVHEASCDQVASRTPVRDVVLRYPRTTIVCFGASMLNAVGFYAVLTFMPNYLEMVLLHDSAQANAITTIVLAVYIVMVVLLGHASDRVGRKPFLLLASTGFLVLTVPSFMMLGTLDFAICLGAELVMAALLALNDGVLASYLAEQYPTEVRFTGFAFSFNLANGIFGGSCTAVCLWLVEMTGNAMAPGVYFALVAFASLVAMMVAHDRTGASLTSIPTQDSFESLEELARLVEGAPPSER